MKKVSNLVEGALAAAALAASGNRAQSAYDRAMARIQDASQVRQANFKGSPSTEQGKFANSRNYFSEGFGKALGGGFGQLLPGLLAAALEHKPGPSEMMGNEFMKGTGKELSSMAGDLVRSLASRAGGAISSMGDASARKAILMQLKKEDPVIARADDKLLMEAFDTMVKFAPTLAKDKNAVRAYLREAVLSGTGPNYATIKMLADAERSVRGEGK